MEKKQILHQRFNYAEIIPYRNSSKIKDRPRNLGMNTFDVDGVVLENDGAELFESKRSFSDSKTPSRYDNCEHKPVVAVTLHSKSELKPKQKNGWYFYSDEEVGIRVPIRPYFIKGRHYITTNDRHIKNHFNRPFSSISTIIHERTIYQDGDKLTVKINSFKKARFFNCKFFKKQWSTKGFSINLKTGNFVTFSKESDSKILPRVRKNVFSFLIDTFDGSFLNYQSKIDNLTTNPNIVYKSKDAEKLTNEFKLALNDTEFIQVLNSHLIKIPGFIPEDLPHTSLVPENTKIWLLKTMMKLFITIKGIKAPNDYEHLLVGWYPTKVYLKKNQNKLIASILDRLKIKSKHTIKLLHENPNMDITRMYNLVKYFGFNDFHRYLGNIDPYYFSGDFGKKARGGAVKTWYPDNVVTPYQINDNEKSNVLKLINEFVKSNKIEPDGKFSRIVNLNMSQIDDHFRMIENLKPYFPEVELRANNWKSFNKEHAIYSRLQGLIRRGYTIEFKFGEKMLEDIEKPIITGDGSFFPVILKTDTEYTEEGKHMHHCVGGYVEYSSSLIVSLRYGSKTSPERVTCEFDSGTKKERQSRYFCNALPPAHFTDALVILYNRINEYPESIIALEKVKTPLVFGKDGKTIEEIAAEHAVATFYDPF